jgi:hypothetical protein
LINCSIMRFPEMGFRIASAELSGPVAQDDSRLFMAGVSGLPRFCLSNSRVTFFRHTMMTPLIYNDIWQHF